MNMPDLMRIAGFVFSLRTSAGMSSLYLSENFCGPKR